jgi:hypothetical protein
MDGGDAVEPVTGVDGLDARRLNTPDNGRRCHVEPDRKTCLWLVTRRRENPPSAIDRSL